MEEFFFPFIFISWSLKVRVGCSERTASKHVYYQGWNRSPAQVGYMRQVLWAGALGRPRRIVWRGRWEGGSGWGIHVNPWLTHVNVWQKPLQKWKNLLTQFFTKNFSEYLLWSYVSIKNMHFTTLTNGTCQLYSII